MFCATAVGISSALAVGAMSKLFGACQKFFFFFNDTATTEIYTLSLHDALPICTPSASASPPAAASTSPAARTDRAATRSEEHTSELQSPDHLVCRLLLEKKNIASALDGGAMSKLFCGGQKDASRAILGAVVSTR